VRHGKAEGLVRGETGSSLEVHSGLLSPLSSSQERLVKDEEEEGEFRSRRSSDLSGTAQGSSNLYFRGRGTKMGLWYTVCHAIKAQKAIKEFLQR